MGFTVGDTVLWETRSKIEPLRIGVVKEYFQDPFQASGDYLDVQSSCGKSCGQIFHPHPNKMKKLEGLRFTLEEGEVFKIESVLSFDQRDINGNKYVAIDSKNNQLVVSHQELVDRGVKWISWLCQEH